MLTAYHSHGTGVRVDPAFAARDLTEDIVWIDAYCPDEEELAKLGALAGFDLPNRHDMTEIELSSRLYHKGAAHVMIASLLPKSETEVLPPRQAAFILMEKLLLTIRFCEFFSFERMAAALASGEELCRPETIFCRLLDEAVSDRADNLEFSMHHMEELTSRLFRSRARVNQEESPDDPDLAIALRHIGGMGERVANIRESIASLQRLINYARTYIPAPWLGDQMPILNSMRTDLTALSDEASFFMNKLSFNLDATLGMINIEETKIIRLLSIVTLLLSPPTLIAGIYGMNFRAMPELDWPLGYAFSLGIMIITSITSIWYLKRKKWM